MQNLDLMCHFIGAKTCIIILFLTYSFKNKKEFDEYLSHYYLFCTKVVQLILSEQLIINQFISQI